MDSSFGRDADGLAHALRLLLQDNLHSSTALPLNLPEQGLGEVATLTELAPLILGGASRLGDATSMAHMDPPTPWISWATTLWNASLNQNLLHPATAPVARDIEALVVEWLAPYFGMQGGHMVPGSTIANLTALWAARELKGIKEVVHADTAHLSIAKAAHILGLRSRPIASNWAGALRIDELPDDLSSSALVLTAGTTSTGAVDDLTLAGLAAWTHVDAAWAGPLRLSQHYASRLNGIERADSVAISAHKWLFQPKESALVLFRQSDAAHQAISFGGSYLAVPNVGLLGSHGAVAVPLLATLLAWGRSGLAERIEICMGHADQVAARIKAEDGLELLIKPETGVVVWRPSAINRTEIIHAAMPAGSTSFVNLSSGKWLRNVAANPNLDVLAFESALGAALRS